MLDASYICKDMNKNKLFVCVQVFFFNPFDFYIKNILQVLQDTSNHKRLNILSLFLLVNNFETKLML